ncbi:carboxymuconolactone decarboxylase family protein [Aliiroseovarius subalbicans]|uniref:carboxymuconolactone decarboxylase family protein n=1 Tax=Aliiroseovarius subalbicans TaxID=2925840 RepID=UPI001F5879CA|nr:carboxymuconolactone decarboxylase family protein [Aliiroseovarius subalbicans]MCI2398031.1 carboxymuconolactone decarboxylase family protein [Aliiroseovarius subalbicans]
MSDFSKLYADMMAQGQEMLRQFNPALETFKPQGFDKLMPTMPKDMMDMMFGNAFNKDGLDAKTRMLITLAGLTVLGAQADAQIKMTVRHALEAGATQKEIAEVIYQMSMLGGLPAMTRALELAQAVFDENDEEGSA